MHPVIVSPQYSVYEIARLVAARHVKKLDFDQFDVMHDSVRRVHECDRQTESLLLTYKLYRGWNYRPLQTLQRSPHPRGGQTRCLFFTFSENTNMDKFNGELSSRSRQGRAIGPRGTSILGCSRDPGPNVLLRQPIFTIGPHKFSC